MRTLMITWTDIFYATGDFFQWCFKGMRVLGQFPNVMISLLVIGLLTYWSLRIVKQNKDAQRNGTYK